MRQVPEQGDAIRPKPRDTEMADLTDHSDDDGPVFRPSSGIPLGRRATCGPAARFVCSSTTCLIIGLLIGLSVNSGGRETHEDGYALGGDDGLAPEILFSTMSPNTTVVRKECTLRDVNWIYIPGNGFNFALILIGCGCPDLPDDLYPSHEAGVMNLAAWSYTYQSQYCAQLGKMRLVVRSQPPLTFRPHNSDYNVVIMIRDPRQRLVAAYNNRMNAPGLSREQGHAMREGVKSLQDFVTFKGVVGCQARMLLGDKCANDLKPTLNPKEESEMLVRLEEMAYVGISDHWELSVKLFHATFGGGVSAEDLAALQPNESTADQEGQVAQLNENTDRSDWKVYVFAVQLFVDRVRSKLPGEPIPKELADIAALPHPAYP